MAHFIAEDAVTWWGFLAPQNCAMAELEHEARCALILYQPHDLDAPGQRPPGAARLGGSSARAFPGLRCDWATSHGVNRPGSQQPRGRSQLCPPRSRTRQAYPDLGPNVLPEKGGQQHLPPGGPGETPSRNVGVWGGSVTQVRSLGMSCVP